MNIDQQEVQKFADLAEKWWDKSGDFKPLHVINRNKFIQDMKNALIRLTKKLT